MRSTHDHPAVPEAGATVIKTAPVDVWSVYGTCVTCHEHIILTSGGNGTWTHLD